VLCQSVSLTFVKLDLAVLKVVRQTDRQTNKRCLISHSVLWNCWLNKAKAVSVSPRVLFGYKLLRQTDVQPANYPGSRVQWPFKRRWWLPNDRKTWIVRCFQGFFRRTVQNEQRLGRSPYACQNAGNCAIGRDSRNGCQACRFKKCLDSGMSTDCELIECTLIPIYRVVKRFFTARRIACKRKTLKFYL